MGWYERHVVAPLTNRCCGVKPVRRQREKVVPLAEGRVLEIGMGSGLNLAHYDADKVTEVIGLEPSAAMRKLAADRVAASPIPVEWLDLKGEEIPLDTASVDTVLVTYTLCTIPDAPKALDGMRRVLKPDGKLIFCEHGRAPDAGVARWQNIVNPFWRAFSGGCNINRDIPALLRGGGFDTGDMETMYLPGTARIFGYNFWGTARAA